EPFVRRLRREALRTASPQRATARSGDGRGETGAGESGPVTPDLGLVHRLLPSLDVIGVPDRNGPELGMIADGRGSAAVLELPGGALPSLPVGLIAAWLREDPARPAAAQLVVEQFGLPPWDLLYRYQPTLAYRQLPVQGVPVAVRSWLVVRHEPLDAPESVSRRGGGVPGAGSALASATARLRARLAAHGVDATTLGVAELRELLRQTGDVTAGGKALPGCWAGEGATHCTVTADVGSQADWARLLNGLAHSGADRLVTAATVDLDADEPRVRTAVRVVSTVGQHAATERDRLIRGGTVGPPGADQLAGVLATLPVAYPAHALAEATGSALMGQRW
uniref:type VII secretion protein EccE n=2 Tax=unclassified Streptomyces TaxID=2593676 RepID=UPI000CD58464